MKIPAKHIPHNLTSDDKRRIAFAICERIGRGELLTEIAEEEGMPCSDTFLNWCKADLEIALAYAGSKEDRIERLMSEMLRIADEKVPTYKDKRDNVRMDPSAAAEKRLRVNIRRWLITVLVSHRSRTSPPTDSPASTASAPTATSASKHQQPTGHPLENPRSPAYPVSLPTAWESSVKLPLPISQPASQQAAPGIAEPNAHNARKSRTPLTGPIIAF